MRAPTRTHAIVLAISAALAVAGCSGDGEKKTADGGGGLFLQSVAAHGPDPFTDSTAQDAGSPPPVTRSPQPSPTGSATPQGTRSVSGETPGLYGGTHSVGSCDVDRQVRFLTADRTKADAFARASGIGRAAVPDYLRNLTSVVLRTDTRVTNHGFRDGSATNFQSVLQSGTAVLVDDRGLPRVRCACGNPLGPPVASKSPPRHHGKPWSGYRPAQVVVVTPAPRPITDITIVNIVDNTWIERQTGDEHARNDRATEPPSPPAPTPTPTTPTPTTPPPTSPDGTDPDESGPGEQDRDRSGAPDRSPDPGDSSTDCPAPTGTPTDPSSPLPSGCPSSPAPPTDTLPAPDELTEGPSEDEDGLVPDDPYLSENPFSDSDPGTFDT
ncbi:DUF6777 domain-containing protein [Streptomyces sp. NPDC058308]|uniref:DUF6777 domain-containing protein n=1 Tax=Streptomyces sp. NPDC058308 TaxID=3346440 RepID=UPI0036E7126A